ncbi:isocitrate lyase/phosphoenolpyruvate mutase family protein [Arthrobacter sp. NPDC090010]|uniref:isocitrate lyase/PEP mutase family protein n=1 Tax=Arthrobacter sp. NPDC090010 TaxID=3363942 RepID=UPI00381A59D7
MSTQSDLAVLFRTLHVPGTPLVLPNVWDAVSARLAEEAGAKAIATTSAGLAWSLGAADGHRLSRDDALLAAERIITAVDGRLPVTLDIEDGFAATSDELMVTIRRVVDLGAVGINLEDSLRPVAEQCERIAAARAVADASGVALFINARVDTHRLLGDRERWLAESLERGRRYAAAGADGVFLLGTLDADAVRSVASGLPVPLNVAVDEQTLDVGALAAAGVARVSAGSAIAEAAYALASRASRELVEQGTSATLAGRTSWSALNGLFG